MKLDTNTKRMQNGPVSIKIKIKIKLDEKKETNEDSAF